MTQQEKNRAISNAISATRKKRKSQVCKVFKFKIDRDSLNKEQKESLKMFFIEAKRVYNYILGEKLDPYSISYKDLKHITYLDKDKNKIDYTIHYIGSSVIADTITIMKESIKGLSASKKNGDKVGGLKFKSECKSIRLRQYGVTHSIRGSKFKIQGIKKPIRVNGLKQLNRYDNLEYTIAHLLYDGYDYFISLTCFMDKDKENKIKNDNIIGVDFGCETTVTSSDGKKIKISIGESERLKGLQNKLKSQTKGSNNWYKTRSKIRKEYNKMTNKKNDIANKIVHDLSSNRIVVIQDDAVDEWHENKYTSKTVQHSVIGRVKDKLKKQDNTIVLDKWFPTTKHCFECDCNNDISLSNRVYKCSCGSVIDRDVHAAKNMIEYYLKIQSVGTIDLKPGRKIAYDKYRRLFEQEAR